MSPSLMGMCAERGVGVSFLTENGRFLARVQGAATGNVLLRREQYVALRTGAWRDSLRRHDHAGQKIGSSHRHSAMAIRVRGMPTFR